jgi:gamma-glutamylcyclotransferase (GGCT)/AIG2-like uncharacterized protein YtfP
MYKVFVYGSLLRGMHNCELLADCKKVGETRTPEGFKLIDLGYFPGALKTEKGTVIGEVYEVDDTVLRRLDRLEGFNVMHPTHGMYDRIEIDTEFGKTYIYIYNDHYSRGNNGIIENGDWRTYFNNKMNQR